MRPQLLYLLLALTRVAGAWDALLADDGTIDLGGNVVAVAEDPDDPVAVPGNLGVQPTVRNSAVNPAPDRCRCGVRAWHDRHRHAALPGSVSAMLASWAMAQG